jgi:glycosyltransferase involved in cell wall biosynthesis
MIFIGPVLLSGIGQVVNKYKELCQGEYYQIEHIDSIPHNQDVFIFALPIEPLIEKIPYIKNVSKKVICMSVCETETVHERYGQLFALFDSILTPSEFCKKVFTRQFPGLVCDVIRHYVPVPPLLTLKPKNAYTFYHIGNIIDKRKNIGRLIHAFQTLNLPDSRLVLKATCVQDVQLRIPNVLVINGLLPETQLQRIHASCDCYVSFSHSEGAGMGAIEAAMHDKPVIITEYGASPEYIKTPYTIQCTRCPVGQDDFLFKKDMLWGDPDYNQLLKFMKDAYEKQLRVMDHSHTKKLVDGADIRNQLASLFI